MDREKDKVGYELNFTKYFYQYKPLRSLKDITSDDYLLLGGDPAIIGVTCSVVSDLTNGQYKLLKWDRQEKTYYPIEINIFQK